MKKTELMKKANRAFHRTGLKFKKHGPEIAIGAGVIGMVAAGVMACKATTKLSTVLEETKETIDQIHEVAADPNMVEKYTEEDKKKDLVITYTQTGLKLAKLYGPSIALGAVSIGCILYSHKIMRGRNAALAAAYATVNKSFKDYRGRVVDRFGKELDRELKHDIKAVEVDEVVVNEDGTETVVKKHIDVVNPEGHSEYARFFAEGCRGWEKNAELNMLTLKQYQNWANDKLKADGHLYLNDVYKMLGLPMTKAGHVVGWVYDDTNPDYDNYVDFGIMDVYTPNKKLNESRMDFINGFERNILLDFNVQGDIYELLFPETV